MSSDEEKLRYLRVALTGFGAIFIAGIYVMMMWVWPSVGCRDLCCDYFMDLKEPALG